MKQAFVSSAPGRLCLFGEHQDYLGLPVIAMAMNRRVTLHFTPLPEPKVQCISTAMGPMAEFNLANPSEIPVTTPLGMALRSLLQEHGGYQGPGWRVHIESEVPIRAGCSSSTALMTAWTAAWLVVLTGGFDVNDVVQRCHKYEVIDFHGAGGNMDQFACAHGGIHRFGQGKPQPLRLPEGAFVLGDSGEPKDTQGHLRRCRDARIPLMRFIDAVDPMPHADDQALLAGTRINRNLESHWSEVMAKERAHGPDIGRDLSRHHAVLRDTLRLSTPRIEAMLLAAVDAGAWGGKINGSGGGGCAFVLTPQKNLDAARQAMILAGAAGAWAVEMDHGVTCEV